MREWTMQKCPCGDKVCKKYFINISSDGRFTKEEAELIVKAPGQAKRIEELENAIRRLLPAGVTVYEYLQAIKGKPEPY